MHRQSRLRLLCKDICFCCVARATDLCHAFLRFLEQQHQRRQERRFQRELLGRLVEMGDEEAHEATQETLFFFP